MLNNYTLEKLEYFKVLEQIANFAQSDLTKQKILKTRPFNQLEKALLNGKMIEEAKQLLIENIFPPDLFNSDIIKLIHNSRVTGSFLPIKTIREIGNLLASSRIVLSFLNSNIEKSPILHKEFSEFLHVDRNLENRIESIIDRNDEVKSSASPKLKEIRKSITDKELSLKRIAERKLKSLSKEQILQEDFLTIYEGRFVFPVKAEYKRQISGLIHSESATGQTVYIEPTEILESNNEIISLKFEEKREVERILKYLTEQIGESSKYLIMSLETLVEIEVVFAKAKYSINSDSCFPELGVQKPLRLIRAFHPVLLKKMGKKTIPLTIDFGENNVLLITGPNAGGKTVVLKTVALLTLMMKSGLHVPTSADSVFYFFDKIMADIGDDQSIEENLSTFSSHLANMNSILNVADESSLILLDEIGTGTDPNEGSALAASILLNLARKKSKIIASTHQSNLKILADSTEGFENASLEFNLEKIEPTFKLKQGEPGASYAFEVAEQIGLNKEIISEAKNYLTENRKQVEELLVKLQKQSNDLQKRLQNAERENSRLRGLSELYEKQATELKIKKSEILRDARTKAKRILEQSNKEVEKAIKEIRESEGKKEKISDARKIISNFEEAIVKDEKIEEEKIVKLKNQSIEIGDSVQIKESNTIGEVSEIDRKKKKAIVVSGSFKILVKLSEIEKVKKQKSFTYNHSKNSYNSVLQSITLDIRGKKPEEVEYEVVKFLDDAYSSNSKQVDIIHGKGSGVLKATVHEILKNHEFVKSYNFAKIELGGEGTTVVNLG